VENMKLHTLNEYIDHCIHVRGLTRQRLADIMNVSKSTLWRACQCPPWERYGGYSGRLMQNLSVALNDSWSKIAWMSGYNPFVVSGLNFNELHTIWQMILKIVYAVKSGTFDGDLQGLVGMQINDLVSYSLSRRIEQRANQSSKEE